MHSLRLRTLRIWFALALVCAFSLWGCGGSGEQAAPPPLPVVVAEVEVRDVPLSMEMVGSTRGTQDVPIRARVEGFLETMNFREGRFVDKGDLLYTIDPEPFAAKVVEAQSQLASAQTTLAKAEADLGRIRPLAEMKAVSEQDLDSAVAMDEAARAGVQAAEAGLRLAEINLGYTKIYAPIDGLIGLTKAKPGEFVGREPNPVVLNVLSDINPIRVRFSISESEYLILARTFMKNNPGVDERRDRGLDTDNSGDDNTDNLILILADGSEHPYKGYTVAASQAIDPTTGTYTVEAAFPNPNSVLLPGQFARVRAPYQTIENAVLVPRKAVVDMQGQFQVYVVNDQNVVESRKLKLGPNKNLNVIVEEGLSGGEAVIVEGLQKVRPGMIVAPKAADAARESQPMQET